MTAIGKALAETIPTGDLTTAAEKIRRKFLTSAPIRDKIFL